MVKMLKFATSDELHPIELKMDSVAFYDVN